MAVKPVLLADIGEGKEKPPSHQLCHAEDMTH